MEVQKKNSDACAYGRNEMNAEKIMYCNKCGKTIKSERGIAKEDVIFISHEWGYFSQKDGERHSFCLCEACYDKLRESFAIPVQTEEYTI